MCSATASRCPHAPPRRPATPAGPKEGARKAWVTSTSGKTQNSEAEIQLLTLQQGVTAQSSLARGARAQQQDKRMSLLSVPESSTDLGSSGRPVRRVSQPKGFGGPRLSGVEEEGPSMSASARKSKQSARKSARSGLFEGKSHRSAASVGEGGR